MECMSCVRTNLSMSSAYCHASILTTAFLSPSAVPCVIFCRRYRVMTWCAPFELQSFVFLRIHAFKFVSCIPGTLWVSYHLRLALTGAMYSRKRPDSYRFMRGRSRVFCFDSKSLGTFLFSTTVKVVRAVAHHQWMDLIINIQRSRTPLVFEICLIPFQSVLNADTDEP